MSFLINPHRFVAAAIPAPAGIVTDRPYFRTGHSTAAGTGNVTPTMPTGWRENDILLLAVQSANQAASAPAGYAEVSSSPQGTGTAAATASTRLTLFWKRATSSESAPTITDTGDHTLVAFFAICGCVTSGDPFDAQAGNVEATGSSTITWPGVTTTVNNALIVNVVGSGDFGEVGSAANADLIFPTEDVDIDSLSGVNGAVAVISGLRHAAGSVGSTTATYSTPDVGKQGRITLALKPRAVNMPIFVSAGTMDAGGADLAPGVPPGYQAGDIFILVVESANQAVSAPSGYAAVGNSPQGTGSAGVAGGTRLSVFWKRASASESAPTVADSGDHQVARILCLRGCLTSGDPWEASAGDVEASSTTAVSMPGVTTLGSNRLILHMMARDTDALDGAATVSGWQNSTLDFVTEVIDNSSGTLSGGGFAVAVGGMYSAGAIGSTTATLSTASPQGRITLAFPPA